MAKAELFENKVLGALFRYFDVFQFVEEVMMQKAFYMQLNCLEKLIKENY